MQIPGEVTAAPKQLRISDSQTVLIFPIRSLHVFGHQYAKFTKKGHLDSSAERACDFLTPGSRGEPHVGCGEYQKHKIK